MESSRHNARVFHPWLALVTGMFVLSASSVWADTYRWKDKNGKVHYGSAVPAEYADQPYDILNDNGLVIEHVEDTSLSVEARNTVEEKAPLISEEERQSQYERLLVIQYSSVEEIENALEVELAQLSYDKRIIEQSHEATAKAIRDQIRQAADQQRAGQAVPESRVKAIEKLYARQEMDQERRLTMNQREAKIRARFQTDLDNYRRLSSPAPTNEEAPTDQG